ncbi:MAG: periplasmic heavy metal sensor, partial [Planctomycetota bacterium]
GKMMQGGMIGGMMQGMMGKGMMQGMMSKDIPNAQKLLALADELKLKDDQIKSLKTLSLNSQKESIRQNADLAIAKVELNALLGQEDIDLVQVQQKVREVANLEAEVKIAQIETAIKAKEVLTTEQQALLKEITKKKAKVVEKPAATTGKARKMMPQATEHEEHH